MNTANTTNTSLSAAELAGINPPGTGTGKPGHAVGQGAMWIFIVGDLYVFGGWFVFYLIWRYGQHQLFLDSQIMLDRTLGMVNTVILLISSWFIALCVNSSRAGNYKQAIRFAELTIAAGVIFGASKVYEWSSKIAGGQTFTSNDFFMFYYFLTGIHLFHVLCGFIVLTVLIKNLQKFEGGSPVVTENCAAYWHMVDLLWVVIFALLYVMR